MRRMTWMGLTVMGVLTLLGPTGWAKGDGRDQLDRDQRVRGCSVGTLRGAYGIRMQGTRPSAPGGPVEDVVGVIWREYDGRGNFRQIDNIKGSISGIVADRPGFGTYTMNEDCTGTTSFQPGPGATLVESLIAVDGGREVLSVVTSPQPVMVSSVQTRVARVPGW